MRSGEACARRGPVALLPYRVSRPCLPAPQPLRDNLSPAHTRSHLLPAPDWAHKIRSASPEGVLHSSQPMLCPFATSRLFAARPQVQIISPGIMQIAPVRVQDQLSHLVQSRDAGKKESSLPSWIKGFEVVGWSLGDRPPRIERTHVPRARGQLSTDTILDLDIVWVRKRNRP